MKELKSPRATLFKRWPVHILLFLLFSCFFSLFFSFSFPVFASKSPRATLWRPVCVTSYFVSHFSYFSPSFCFASKSPNPSWTGGQCASHPVSPDLPTLAPQSSRLTISRTGRCVTSCSFKPPHICFSKRIKSWNNTCFLKTDQLLESYLFLKLDQILE